VSRVQRASRFFRARPTEATLQRNFNEEKGFVTFTLAELDGIAPDVISGYKKHENEDAYDVTFKTPDLLPIVCLLDLSQW
jgi:hypothetical protein